MDRLLLANKFFFNKNVYPTGASNARYSFFSFGTPFKCLFTGIAVLVFFNTWAQQNSNTQQETDYKKAIKERSEKIVNELGLTDQAVYNKVTDLVSNQYFGLNDIQQKNMAVVAEIKKQSLDKAAMEEALKKQEEKKSSELLQLHRQFIGLLKQNLSDDQLEKVKDGMTYRIFPITYAAYQDMLPNLTAEQKEKIYGWLKEARELAMDQGSSDDKHKVFGKYKGRINNYLSAEGYDLKKETAAWQARIKEREEQKNNPKTN